MAKGIGTDIIEIDRIEKIIEKYGQKFIDRLFTKKEQNYCTRYHKSARHYAGRFAAKEAISKALGTGIGKDINWLDMEILNDAGGAPFVALSPQANALFGNPKILLSISHAKAFATAVALIISSA